MSSSSESRYSGLVFVSLCHLASLPRQNLGFTAGITGGLFAMLSLPALQFLCLTSSVPPGGGLSVLPFFTLKLFRLLQSVHKEPLELLLLPAPMGFSNINLSSISGLTC